MMMMMYAYLIEKQDGSSSECDVTDSTSGSADVLIKFDVFMSGLKGPNRAKSLVKYLCVATRQGVPGIKI